MKNKQIILDSIKAIKDLLAKLASTGDPSLIMAILSEIRAIESLIIREN
jgi:DNA-binding phage protein